MANGTMKPTEQALVEALSQWTAKQGVVLVQINPFFFMQVLREQGLEIVKSDELTKIRYEHKYLKELVNTIYKTATAARTKILQLDENKDLLREPTEQVAQTNKTPSKRVPTGERPPRKV